MIRQPRIWKTVLMSIALFVTGSLLLYFGVQSLGAGEKDRAIAMLVLGSIAFLPGFYAVWLLVGAAMGLEGYAYEDIPSFDDD